MQAPQSSTASGNFRCIGPLTVPLTVFPASSPAPQSAPAPASRRLADGAGLAHDAANLLGALTLYADLLDLPGVLTPAHHHLAQDLRLVSSRTWALLDRLLQPIRLQPDRLRQGRPSDSPGPYSGSPLRPATSAGKCTHLPTVLDRCRGLLRTLTHSDLQLDFDPAAPVFIDVSEEDVERILVNLIKNAAQACNRNLPGQSVDDRPSSPEPAITLSIQAVSSSAALPHSGIQAVALTVSDRGPGMTRDAIRRALTAQDSPSNGPHGLGLGIVRELAATTGGVLSIDSRIGEGTTVEILWPVTADPFASAGAPC